jgi:hypothetical protein
MVLYAVSVLQRIIMPKTATLLPSGVRTTDTLTVTQFAATFPVDTINEVLEELGCGTVRVRHLPNEFVIYFVMMLALFRDCSHREVYRCVALALNRLMGKGSTKIFIPSASALSQARSRVKDERLKRLFHKLAVPVGKVGEKGVWYRRWRKMAIDGCLVNAEDTPSNRKTFGRATNQHTTIGGAPQLRFVSLMEIGTHLFVGAAMGGYYDGETSLAKEVVSFLKPDMICMADRNFYSFDIFKQITDRGAAVLFRLQKGMSFASDKQLEDDSHLITIYSSTDTKKSEGIKARLIQYKMIGSPTKEAIFLITNILDAKEAPANELAALYHERWEYENALDELKTHLNAKSIVLRSKTPELVKQELWGMLMTHYVIRSTMYQAASREKLDPDRLSFTHTVRVVKRTLVKSASGFSPSTTTPTID